jgi:hypothetical protein
MALGDVVCAWLLLRQAPEVALEKLGRDVPARTRRSTRARSRPRSSSPRPRCRGSPAERRIAEHVDLGLMDLDESAF